MSRRRKQGTNTVDSADGTNSVSGNVLMDVNIEIGSEENLLMSDEVSRQIKAAADPLTKQLGCLCDLIRASRRKWLRPKEEVNNPVQGSSRATGNRSDNMTKIITSSFLKQFLYTWNI